MNASDPPHPLAFEGVTRRFDRSSRPAVDGVDLHVGAGEIVGLIGESGCGKTTLLRLAAGLESPDAGSVYLAGRGVAGEAAPAGGEVPPERRRVGLVFQDGALFPHLTARKNVAYGLDRLARGDREERIAKNLERVGLADKADRYPHQLSGGERQRLALARALAPEPDLVLLDEPFSHLDPALRRHLREEIRDLLGQLRQAALLVTHDPEDALAIASRVAVMNEGRLRQTGTPTEVYRHPIDRYCAERFGPANRVIDPATGGERWLRPEAAAWKAGENGPTDTDAHPVRVTSVRPLGNGHELRVRPTEADPAHGETWICLHRDPETAPPIPGDLGRIKWSPPPSERS